MVRIHVGQPNLPRFLHYRPIDKSMVAQKVYEVDNFVNLDYRSIVMPTKIADQISRMHLPSGDKAIVSELTDVMRRHADLSPTKVARLVDIAFGITLGGRTSREQKLASARVRGLEARQSLVEAEGGSLSSEEVAGLLQISKTAVLKRLSSGRLLAWREERLKAARFPRWQFDDHGRVLDGVETTLKILNEDDRLDPWGKMLFFLQERPSLGDRRPLDLLRQGKLKEVTVAAQAYAE